MIPVVKYSSSLSCKIIYATHPSALISSQGWVGGGESFLSYHHVQAVSNLLSLFSGGGSALGDAAGRLGRGEDVHLGAL